MEKRQLVRTFGSALAAATLSFGLFAAPAIADPAVVAKGDVESVAGIEVKDWKAQPGTQITFYVPVEMTEIKSADQIEKATVTFSGTDTGVTQEYDAQIASSDWYQSNKTTPVDANADLSNYKKVYGRVTVTVDAQFLSGSWSAKELTVKVDGETNPIVVDLSGANFEVVDGAKAADFKAPRFEEGTLELYRSELTSKDDNELSVRFEDNSYRGSTDIVSAKYANPSGNQFAIVNDATAIPAKTPWSVTVVDTPNTADQIFKATTTELPNTTQGIFTLNELKVRQQVMGTGENQQQQPVTGLYLVDYYDDAFLGSYEVTAGLVVPMYRVYNPYDGQHLYTDSIEEATKAVFAGWEDEGIAWYAPADVWDNAVKKPVYRLYNQYNGDHHYTTSQAEALSMVANGWTDEGVGFYSLIEGAYYRSTLNDTYKAAPVYRLFNQYATVGTHHYTTDKDEYDELVKVGWTGENVGWYGVNWEKSNE